MSDVDRLTILLFAVTFLPWVIGFAASRFVKINGEKTMGHYELRPGTKAGMAWVPDSAATLVEWRGYMLEPVAPLTGDEFFFLTDLIMGQQPVCNEVYAPVGFDVGPHWNPTGASRLFWSDNVWPPGIDLAWSSRFPDDDRPRR